MMFWMIAGVVALSLLGWKVIHNAEADDKLRKQTRKAWER
jgi:hypothetical protein